MPTSGHTEPGDRLFVPLASEPFHWFRQGDKRWELRRNIRQYTEKHVVLGRRVELRRGYASRHDALWGTIQEVVKAPNIEAFFQRVPFSHVIPPAKDEKAAIEIAASILDISPTGSDSVIGFKVLLDETRLKLHPDFLPALLEGRKTSTIRAGWRDVRPGPAVIIAGDRLVNVIVTTIRHCRQRDLTGTDAREDGFETLSELLATLRQFYPDLSDDSPVSVIGLRVSARKL